MKVHVTGAEGFIGKHLLGQLFLRGHEVVGDDPDLVIHAGALVGRERCARRQFHAINQNVISTLLRAEECAKHGTSFLYVSSVEAERPSNLYALTKHWAEEACTQVMPSEHLTIARLGAQYGPGARMGADTLSNFLLAAMQGKELRVYRDSWRTWTYVEDTARALVLIAEATVGWREHGKHSSKPALYNVDSGENHQLLKVAEYVTEIVGGGEIFEVAAPVGYSELPVSDTTCLRALGWEPQVTLDEGLVLTYAQLREALLTAA